MRRPRSLSESSDEYLMRLVQQGRADAYEVLYDRLSTPAFSIARQLTCNSAVAEDAMQDAFVAIWRDCRQYRPELGSVRSWALRIVHNQAIDGLRRSQRHESRRAAIDGSHERQAAPESIEREVGLRAQAGTLREMLAQLPEDQRRVLELAYLQDLTQSQIARVLGLPLGTVKGRARLGLGGMRNQLDDRLVAALA